MTETQRSILVLIAKYQLENPNEKGIKPRGLLDACTDAMLCYNNQSMKEYLNEAKDHKVVMEKTDEDGQTYFYMPYASNLLEKIS